MGTGTWRTGMEPDHDTELDSLPIKHSTPEIETNTRS